MPKSSKPVTPDTAPATPPLRCPDGTECARSDEVLALRARLDELANQVHTDALTGLANYRAFTQALEQEMERTRRTDQPTSLIMLDIDHFKKVNDVWGHEVGNQALRHVARLLQQTVRKLDIPCRYGGEEFAVILPNTRLADSIPVAERLRLAIAQAPLTQPEGLLWLTASLGIDTFVNDQQAGVEELVQRADHYLYQAKQEGRNQVRHASLPAVAAVSREEREDLIKPFADTPENPGTGSGETE